MYRMSFLPRFFEQKRRILAQDETPPIPLPPAVEASLGSVESSVHSLAQLGWYCLRRIWPFLLRSTGVCALAALFAVIATLAGMELLKGGKSTEYLVLLSSTYFCANALGQLCVFVNSQLRNYSSHTIQAYLVNLISRKVLNLSAGAAARQSSGNLKVLITSDTVRVGEFVDNAVRNLIPALTSLFLILPLLIHFSGKAGGVGMLIMMSFIPISILLNQVNTILQNRGQTALDSLASLLGEWIKNVRLIRYLSWAPAFQGEIIQRLRRYMGFSTFQHLLACLIFGLSVSWWMVSVLGVFWVARQSSQGLELNSFFASLWLLTFLSGFFTHIPNTIRLLGLAIPAMRRILQLLLEEEQQSLCKEDGFPKLENDFPASVIFEHVSFAYQPSGPFVIRDLSVTLNLSRKVALLGEITSGKTTFLKLLCGEFPPTQGRIRVRFDSGAERDLWSTSAYQAFRGQLAWVPQEPFVSCDPFSANISLTTHPDESTVMQAAYWAELEADLSRFPNGIHEEIGEGGINLSGGQKQRLNLARAYFANRRYLVLDDPLSALDSQTELMFMTRLENRSRGFILVTHRVAEIARVEEVLILKEGQLIEWGDPRSLGSDSQSEFSRICAAYSRAEVEGGSHA